MSQNVHDWISSQTDAHRATAHNSDVVIKHASLPVGNPARVATLLVYTQADVVHIETGKVVMHPEVLAQWDSERADPPLDALPCVVEVTGGEHASFWVGGEASLSFFPAAGALRCVLAFELSRFPTELEVARILRVVEEKLFNTWWGHDLSFGCKGNLMISIGSKVLAHRIDCRVA